jgi:hypothetical protein
MPSLLPDTRPVDTAATRRRPAARPPSRPVKPERPNPRRLATHPHARTVEPPGSTARIEVDDDDDDYDESSSSPTPEPLDLCFRTVTGERPGP